MKDTIRRLVAGKRVLLLGFGREGRSTLRLLQEIGGYADVTVADQNPVDAGTGVAMLCGAEYQSTLDDYDIVFKSPGIVLEKPIESYHTLITSQTELFLSVYGRQSIGITGTKGKSTTATLLYHVLRQAQVDCLLLGNIGIPPLDRWEEIHPQSVVVLELSCHQLEYTRFSPHIGVLLNVFEEHLDHYGSFARYRAAKENIYRWQQPGDILYCNAVNTPSAHVAQVWTISGSDQPADILVKDNTVTLPDGEHYVIPADRTHLLGAHNAFDIAVVVAIARRSGISPEDITASLASYEPLPHRLQPIGEFDGVRFVDDSISTIGETAIRALETLPDTDTILIGGMERGIDYTDLIMCLSASPVRNILLMEATGERIYREAMAAGVDRPERFRLVGNLENAVRIAKAVTAKGKICLLSPAAASYGIFRNFEQRGERFQQLVRDAANR